MRMLIGKRDTPTSSEWLVRTIKRMRGTMAPPSRIALVLIGLGQLLLTGTPARPAPPSPGAPEDEVAIRQLVERFFAAQEKEDLDAFMALWSRRSPERDSRPGRTRRFFANYDRIRFTAITVRELAVDQDTAPA